MTKLIDALSARTHFGALLEETEKKQTRFLISRRGRPKAVVLSVEDYLRNIVKSPEMLATVQLSAQKSGLDTITDDEIIAEVVSYRKENKKKYTKKPQVC